MNLLLTMILVLYKHDLQRLFDIDVPANIILLHRRSSLFSTLEHRSRLRRKPFLPLHHRYISLFWTEQDSHQHVNWNFYIFIIFWIDVFIIQRNETSRRQRQRGFIGSSIDPQPPKPSTVLFRRCFSCILKPSCDAKQVWIW